MKTMKTIINITLFLYFIGNMKDKNIIHEDNLRSMVITESITLQSQIQARIRVRFRSVLWWYFKLQVFHDIMIVTYIALELWDRTKCEAIITFFLLMYPFLPYFSPLMYWLEIYFSLTYTGIVDIFEYFLVHAGGVIERITRDHQRQVHIQWFQQYNMSQPRT